MLLISLAALIAAPVQDVPQQTTPQTQVPDTAPTSPAPGTDPSLPAPDVSTTTPEADASADPVAQPDATALSPGESGKSSSRERKRKKPR